MRTYLYTCSLHGCKGMGLESAFFFLFPSFIPLSFTKLLLFCSLYALEQSRNETRDPEAFTDQLLQGFLPGGRPRLLEVQLSHPLVLVLRIPAFPMYPVSPFDCTEADLPGL